MLILICTWPIQVDTSGVRCFRSVLPMYVRKEEVERWWQGRFEFYFMFILLCWRCCSGAFGIAFLYSTTRQGIFLLFYGWKLIIISTASFDSIPEFLRLARERTTNFIGMLIGTCCDSEHREVDTNLAQVWNSLPSLLSSHKIKK